MRDLRPSHDFQSDVKVTYTLVYKNMTHDLYTCVFNYMESTFVTQVRADSVDDVIDAWLDALKYQKVDASVAEDMVLLDYFESCVENKSGFEQQIREGTGLEIEGGHHLTELGGVRGVWCAIFMIDLLDIDHDPECDVYDYDTVDSAELSKSDEVDCSACMNQSVHLCELYVIRTDVRDYE